MLRSEALVGAMAVVNRLHGPKEAKRFVGWLGSGKADEKTRNLLDKRQDERTVGKAYAKFAGK